LQDSDFKLNLTSAIGDLANRGFLASYVSRHKAMPYDRWLAYDQKSNNLPLVGGNNGGDDGEGAWRLGWSASVSVVSSCGAAN
jgi:hypothetical protein